MRLVNIDFFKGLLIILVIFGHILQGHLEESIWRTIIYSFHMPLFIGISGFLLNIDKIVKLNLIGLFDKYKFRIILPWVIAVVVHYAISIFNDRIFDVLSLVKAFVYPFYHLWFIPAYLSWVGFTWIFGKFKLNTKILFIVAFIISFISSLLNNFPEIYEGYGPISSILKMILFTFRPYYYFFFVLGIYFRKTKLEKPKILDYLLPSTALVLVIFIFYFPNKSLHILNFFVLNSLLVNLVLKISANNLITNYPKIEWVGVNSLGIYLWHVIPIMACKLLIGTDSLVFFYIFSVLSELIFLMVYKLLLKFSFFRKYVFGI